MTRYQANYRGWARWMLLFAGGVLIAFLIALIGIWQYYQTTPSYAIALLIDAAERNDSEQLDNLIDVDQVLAELTRQQAKKAAGLVPDDFFAGLAGTASTVAPEVLWPLKTLAREEIRLRILYEAGTSGGRPFFVTALGVPFRLTVTRSDRNVCVVKTDSGRLELFFVRRHDKWRLHAVHDEELASRLTSRLLQGRR